MYFLEDLELARQLVELGWVRLSLMHAAWVACAGAAPGPKHLLWSAQQVRRLLIMTASKQHPNPNRALPTLT